MSVWESSLISLGSLRSLHTATTAVYTATTEVVESCRVGGYIGESRGQWCEGSLEGLGGIREDVWVESGRVGRGISCGRTVSTVVAATNIIIILVVTLTGLASVTAVIPVYANLEALVC